MRNLLWKEFLIEWRSKQIVISMFVFGLSSTVIFALAFQSSSQLVHKFAPGFLWIIILFSSTLGLNRLFSYERDFEGCFSWISAPTDRGLIYLSKVVTSFCFLMISEFFFILPFVVLLGISIQFSIPQFFIVLVLGSGAIVSVGCLISGLTLRSQLREMLIPILLFPLVTPVVISATKSTMYIFENRPINQWNYWLLIMFTFFMVYGLLGYLLFDYIVEE